MRQQPSSAKTTPVLSSQRNTHQGKQDLAYGLRGAEPRAATVPGRGSVRVLCAAPAREGSEGDDRAPAGLAPGTGTQRSKTPTANCLLKALLCMGHLARARTYGHLVKASSFTDGQPQPRGGSVGFSSQPHQAAWGPPPQGGTPALGQRSTTETPTGLCPAAPSGRGHTTLLLSFAWTTKPGPSSPWVSPH